eukprot:6211961-Pleurochrysis_carterae.AAC.1
MFTCVRASLRAGGEGFGHASDRQSCEHASDRQSANVRLTVCRGYVVRTLVDEIAFFSSLPSHSPPVCLLANCCARARLARAYARITCLRSNAHHHALSRYFPPSLDPSHLASQVLAFRFDVFWTCGALWQEARESARRPVTLAFQQLMRDAAQSGELGEMLAVGAPLSLSLLSLSHTHTRANVHAVQPLGCTACTYTR